MKQMEWDEWLCVKQYWLVKYNNEQAVDTPFNLSLLWTFIPLVNATAQIEHETAQLIYKDFTEFVAVYSI